MSGTGAAIDTRALEAVLFVSDEPLTPAVLSQALEVDRRVVDDLCAQLQTELAERGSGLVLRNVAGGWRLFTDPETQPIVERFVLSSRQARMTKAALETLAIVAYKQPVTRHQVSAIRGVNADGVLRALVDRGLIEEAGRDEGPGRPLLYATTPAFLERLGLASLAALPSLAPLLDASAAPTDVADRVADPEDEPEGQEPGGEPEGRQDAAEPAGDPDESGPDSPEG
jgi:segregation and condensation protein B